MRYYFSPKMTFKTFKILNEKFCHDSGPTPKHGDEVLHKMLMERTINIYLDTDQPEDPIIITTNNIPKDATLLTNPPITPIEEK